MKLFLLLFKFQKLTVCPCPNHPAENVTEPGSTKSPELLLTKFLSKDRQFGTGLSNFGVCIDFFKRGSMARVPLLTVPCCEYIRYIIIIDLKRVKFVPAAHEKATQVCTITLSFLSHPQAWVAQKTSQERGQEIWPFFYLFRPSHVPSRTPRYPMGFALFKMLKSSLIIHSQHCLPGFRNALQTNFTRRLIFLPCILDGISLRTKSSGGMLFIVYIRYFRGK